MEPIQQDPKKVAEEGQMEEKPQEVAPVREHRFLSENERWPGLNDMEEAHARHHYGVRSLIVNE